MTNTNNFVVKETTSGPNNSGQKIKYIDFPDTVICIYKNANDEFLCIKQYRPVFNEYFIEFPGGSIDNNETVEECGMREFIEETGYIPVGVEKIASVIPSIGLTTEKIHLVSVKSIQSESQQKSESQIMVEWISHENISKMISNGMITDAKTIIGFLMTNQKR